MKRILPIVFVLLILLVAAVLIGPSFVDWNKYKPQIIEQAKSAAGYDVAIDGDIGLSVLPLPQLKIEGLKVAAPRGSQPNLLTMKEAKVSVNLLPLISGEISIDTVRLVNPDIRLEKMADGSNSWMSDKLLADQNDPTRSDNPSAQPDRKEQKNHSEQAGYRGWARIVSRPRQRQGAGGREDQSRRQGGQPVRPVQGGRQSDLWRQDHRTGCQDGASWRRQERDAG